MTVVYEVGTDTLKLRFVTALSWSASGWPEASTFCESLDGTKAMLIGLLAEPFWSPVGAGGALGLATGAGDGAPAGLTAGEGDAPGEADGDAAGLAAGDGEAAGETAGEAAAGLAGAVVGGGAVVGAAGAACWQAASVGSRRVVASTTPSALGNRRSMRAPAMILGHRRGSDHYVSGAPPRGRRGEPLLAVRRARPRAGAGAGRAAPGRSTRVGAALP